MTQLIAEVNNLVSYSISILENKAKYMVHLSDSLADVWPWAPSPDWMTWFEMRITKMVASAISGIKPYQGPGNRPSQWGNMGKAMFSCSFSMNNTTQ